MRSVLERLAWRVNQRPDASDVRCAEKPTQTSAWSDPHAADTAPLRRRRDRPDKAQAHPRGPHRDRRRLVATHRSHVASVVVEQPLAQLGQSSTEQPAHVHLGDAELCGDLALRHVLEEPEQEDALLA